MSKFYIRGKLYSATEIINLAQENFTLQTIRTMPLSLYKYFPNTINPEDGRNYSQEALENNTVFLQQPSLFDDPYDCTVLVDEQEFARHRITHYAQLCGLTVSPEWDYSKIAYEFSCFLYEGIKAGKQMLELFPICPNSKDMVELQNEVFALSLQADLYQLPPTSNIWEQMFYNAIHREYVDVHSNLIQKFRVSCFTETPYSILMWSHYANNHKGFCIEYEVPTYTEPYVHLYHNLMPVIYGNQRVPILEQCTRVLQSPRVTPDILWDIYKYGLLMKSDEWRYQNEWRLISWDDLLSSDGHYNCRFFKIKKVYLGNRMDTKDRLRVIKICKDRQIPYTGVIIAPDKYKMLDCMQLCEDCPRLIRSGEISNDS